MTGHDVKWVFFPMYYCNTFVNGRDVSLILIFYLCRLLRCSMKLDLKPFSLHQRQLEPVEEKWGSTVCTWAGCVTGLFMTEWWAQLSYGLDPDRCECLLLQREGSLSIFIIKTKNKTKKNTMSGTKLFSQSQGVIVHSSVKRNKGAWCNALAQPENITEKHEMRCWELLNFSSW